MTPPIRWRLHLAASPAAVDRLLATAAGRRRFWAESADEEGGMIRFRFPDGTRLDAPIVEHEPGRRFAIGYFDGSRVAFELAPDGRGGTDLTLVETGVPESSWSAQHAGWVAVLFALKGVADFRADLRNHDPGRTWADGFVDG